MRLAEESDAHQSAEKYVFSTYENMNCTMTFGIRCLLLCKRDRTNNRGASSLAGHISTNVPPSLDPTTPHIRDSCSAERSCKICRVSPERSRLVDTTPVLKKQSSPLKLISTRDQP